MLRIGPWWSCLWVLVSLPNFLVFSIWFDVDWYEPLMVEVFASLTIYICCNHCIEGIRCKISWYDYSHVMKVMSVVFDSSMMIEVYKWCYVYVVIMLVFGMAYMTSCDEYSCSMSVTYVNPKWICNLMHVRNLQFQCWICSCLQWCNVSVWIIIPKCSVCEYFLT